MPYIARKSEPWKVRPSCPSVRRVRPNQPQLQQRQIKDPARCCWTVRASTSISPFRALPPPFQFTYSTAPSHSPTTSPVVFPSRPPTRLECSRVPVPDPVRHPRVLSRALSNIVATFNCGISPCCIALGPVALPSGSYSQCAIPSGTVAPMSRVQCVAVHAPIHHLLLSTHCHTQLSIDIDSYLYDRR
ncbi:hypothetical protein BD779DRAFT_426777 [Infundibulicybe gibba]|nr:hypothetical protein BD779DRAFT_426777 [Infundibulicybe gibba]